MAAVRYSATSCWSLGICLANLLFSMRSAVALKSHISLASSARFGRALHRHGSLPNSQSRSSIVPRGATTTLTMTSSYSSTLSRHTPVPRAAVSVVVRHQQQSKPPSFLLIERGNPPNAGVWSVPGGKIELNEKTLEAAKRELEEEVKFADPEGNEVELAWFSQAFCTSDSIIEGNLETGKTGYHYVIAQCFAEVVCSHGSSEPPKVLPADDAKQAKWWTLEEIKKAEEKKETVPNMAFVIERAESLYECGMLPTTQAMHIPNTH